MNNSYNVVWSFRNRIDVLIKSIESAHQTCPNDVNFVLVDGASSINNLKILRKEISLYDREIRVCESNYRTTMQEAWNLGMMLTDSRYAIIASSDVVFLKLGWIEKLREGFNNGARYILIENHAVFALDKTIIPVIGWLDESYRYGPHVDCDYMIRLSEKNIPIHIIANEGCYDHQDELKERLAKDIPDRMSYFDRDNDKIFKDKWETDWPGWGDGTYIHPPTSITEDKHGHIIRRKRPEVDPHPYYTRRCLC